jgi:hypothetical protein
MEISFTIEEKEEETDDGQTVVAFFQKRERFKNFVPFTRIILWDQVQCYGYNRREDGTIEIFHRGESFTGPWPIRFLVQMHARYVIWATEKHINSPIFGSGDLELQEHQRANIPVHAFKDFVNRLVLGYQVAMETGKIAAGTPTHKAEETLAKLKRLQESKTEAYVSTVRKLHRGEKLKRQMTRIEVSNKEDQQALNRALATLSKDAKGQDEATAAISQLVGSTPQMESLREEEPRYGGIFRAKVLNRRQSSRVA